MRRTAAALLVVVVLGACGDHPAPVTSDGGDDAPVITVRTTCYGECGYAGPVDLPDVAVYADGTFVAFDGDVQRTGTVDDLDAVLELAEDAGLFDGGVAVNGTTQGTADGGGTLFTGRSDDEVTVVEAPFLGYAGELPSSGDPEQRRALEELDAVLRAAAEGGEESQPERYVSADEERERCEVVEDVTPRPLLPHERDCDDVRRSLAELHLKELRALRR